MKRRLVTILAVGTFLPVSAALGAAQGGQLLVPGFIQDRALGPKDRHEYIVRLDEGSAILGEADQHGIDLVIDEYAPDGTLLRTVDSPNGAEGPEPIELTGLTAGTYRLVVHTLDSAAAPGRYVMKVNSILSPAENGLRLAAQRLPPPLLELWRAYQTDSQAVTRFLADRKGKGPIIEDLGGDTSRVTYLYYGDAYTTGVQTFGGPHTRGDGLALDRFLHTPLFFASEMVLNDAHYTYGFTAHEQRLVGPGGSVAVTYDVNGIDPLNPDVFGGFSVVAMPHVSGQTYTAKDSLLPHGRVSPDSIRSAALGETRTLSVYTPAEYRPGMLADLVIVFDGKVYDGGPGSLIPTPTILDNLIGQKRIGPTIAVFVNSMGRRDRDLTENLPFANFVGEELIPWVRRHYRIKAGPAHVVVAGSSFGGLAASYCAFVHPTSIGNVLSQSGSYWLTSDWQTSTLPSPMDRDRGDLIGEFMKSPRLPIRFYVEVGQLESYQQTSNNREFRDVLRLKGYAVTYHEFDGGHGYLSWRGSLADGLIALLGTRPH